MNLKNSLASLILIAIIATVTFATVTALIELLPISWTGTIPSKTSISTNTTSISSGNITLGLPIVESIKLTNIGTTNVTLNMTYTGSANLIDYTLTWDCEGESLPVGYYITATFTLTVTEAEEGAFKIDIVIHDVS